MKKILIILTGGTIGSEVKNNIINVTHNNYLTKILNSNFKKIKFKIVKPINILSENVNTTSSTGTLCSIECGSDGSP